MIDSIAQCSTGKSAIVLCINFSYWAHAATVIRSILVNSTTLDAPIFILFDQPNSKWIKRITNLGLRYNIAIIALKFNQLLVDDFKIFGRLSSATYYRIYAPKVLMGYRKILYLDSDIVVKGDISQLIDADLSGYTIGARSIPQNDATVVNKQLQRDSHIPYFNAGVLLIDTERWKSLACTEQICQIIRTESERLTYADQCALNLFFNGSYNEIPLEWNLTRRFFEKQLTFGGLSFSEVKAIRKAISNPQIVHFTGDFKPWHIQCRHPLRHHYWRYRSYFHWYPYGLFMRSRQLYNQYSAIADRLIDKPTRFFNAALSKYKRYLRR